ncbi:hypothetical protein FOL47_007579 [Perkinsus chesapeaki]|uniref:Peptidase A1 domain-containing protein n=1 Tax=Perkinsus chesapeaki TaxID=330153 RepID=A0A7J6LK18_PERCH|nr:hypothetical protein FOL47_007579 [Perkinsus chesapeaki]
MDAGYSNTITLPVQNGYITAEVDGQRLGLMVDSGSPSVKVVDGKWYKKAFGDDACDKPGAACYFCPSTSSCLNGPRYRSKYVDGSISTFANHKALLTLGSRHITNFDVEVVTNFSSPIPGEIPRGIFGISLSCVPGKPSMIEKLKAWGAIGRLSYYLDTRIHPNVYGISGQLILGAPVSKLDATLVDMTPTLTCTKLLRAVPAVWIAETRLFGADGALLSRTKDTVKQSSLGFLDTGSQSIVVQGKEFMEELILHARKNLTNMGYPPEARDKLLREVGGRWYVSSEVLTSLPTIGVIATVAHAGDVRINIEPKMYTLCTSYLYCVIGIKVRDGRLAHASTLGVPFFRGHSIFVDYGTNKVSIMANQS